MADEGYSKQSIDSALNFSRLFFRYLQSNDTEDWNALRSYTLKTKDKKWIDQLDIPQSQTGNEILWQRKTSYDPKEALIHIKCPILSILGEKGVQLATAENNVKMKNLLEKGRHGP